MRKHNINQEFFSNWSHDMAYILGFIIADGSISKTSLNITIHDRDIDILYFIKDKMASFYPLKRWRKDKPQYVTLHASSKQITEDLAVLGVLPNKRKSWLGFTCEVPERFKPDIVRGFFDGDGWIYLSNVTLKSGINTTYLRAGFANKSCQWLNQIKDWVDISGGYLQNRKTWYQLEFCNTDSKRLRDFMYTGGFCFKRKLDKFFSVI